MRLVDKFGRAITDLRIISNKDPYDRELNRHVDIKVLVNKGLGQGL
ncbi:MAG: hypothetical protein WBV69_24065 [Candidatus Sulfotelmatobacter sp.]